MLQNTKNMSENLVFIIGGSYGVDIDVLKVWRQILLLRLSHFVMPHGLALLVLIEQIYRAREIEKGSGYHHG
jgi:23S rRNA (pseudouridine1915-N3)-methyltransferase